MWASAIGFFTGFAAHLLKTAFGVVLGKIAVFTAIQVAIWGIGEMTEEGSDFMGPFGIISSVSDLFTGFDTALADWPTVVWGLNYFHVAYGVNLLLSAVVSSWVMGLIIKASTR